MLFSSAMNDNHSQPGHGRSTVGIEEMTIEKNLASVDRRASTRSVQ
jgi:hypothetical protein